MKSEEKYTNVLIWVFSSIALLASAIMFVGLIGVISKVYISDCILSNVAIFHTLTIDRFILLLIWLSWCSLIAGFGFAFLTKRQKDHQFQPFYSLTVLIGVLPYLTTFLYVLYINQCLWFSVMIIWVGILYFIVHRIIVISKSFGSPTSFNQSFVSQPITIRVLEISSITLACLSVVLPFYS